ncbi:hypothetical protein D3C81_2058690 [compost metagenome]
MSYYLHFYRNVVFFRKFLRDHFGPILVRSTVIPYEETRILFNFRLGRCSFLVA